MKNIILIGMPGAGKSSVGVVLAKKIGYKFIDSDLVIQEAEGKLLHEIIANKGIEGFNALEDKINSTITANRSIIATGGSAVYGKSAMSHFADIGTIVYLQLSYAAVEERLGDLNERGVSIKDGQTLLDLYNERTPLYEHYAHITINCDNKPIRTIIDELVSKLPFNPYN